MEGDYGLFALGKLKDRVAVLEAELAAVRAERARMERHVALMRPESLDRDMIDERAREALNMADAKDIVIFLDSGDRRPARISSLPTTALPVHGCFAWRRSRWPFQREMALYVR